MSGIKLGINRGHDSELNINVAIDLDVLLRTRLLVQAGSGAGKSWALRRIAEQLFGMTQVILIDPEGEFATLRERYGYVLVGKGGETPADIHGSRRRTRKRDPLRRDIRRMKPALKSTARAPPL